MATIDPEQERRRLVEFYSLQMDGELEKVAGQAAELTDTAREVLRANSAAGASVSRHSNARSSRLPFRSNLRPRRLGSRPRRLNCRHGSTLTSLCGNW